MPLLRVRDRDGDRTVALAAAVRVGSGRSCEVRLRADGVAARHCTIEPSPSGWRIRDGGGRSTLVNGRAVLSRRLRTGDRIDVGEARLEWAGGESAESEPKQEPVAAATVVRAAAEDVERLRTTLRALASETDVRKLLTLIVDQVIDLTGAERGFLILRKAAKEGGKARFEMVAARTLDREDVRRPGVKISRSVAREVARTGKPLLTTNAQADARLQNAKSVTGMRLRSVLCLPLAARERFIGFLYVDHRFEEGAFAPADIAVVEAFAVQAAVALEDQRLVAALRERTDELSRSHERIEELNRLLEQRVDRQQQELDEVRTLLRDRADRELRYEYPAIVGRSAAMRDVLRLVDHVTDTSVPVLVLGESGTGKELIARAVHANGPRREAPFVTENCAAIPESLLESALFGHVQGAFTGADRDRAGLFELADGGTLFLDEVGELPPATQVKLLRVLESGELRRVGGKDVVRVNVRVISATNRDLAAMVGEGSFREDVYYRINVLEVRLPPLRERREDIPSLVEHFLALEAAERDAAPRRVTDEALTALCAAPWPGNVRQLRNEVLRALALSESVVLPEVLSPEVRRAGERAVPLRTTEAGTRPLKEIVREAVDEVERREVSAALRRSRWRKAAAARALGVSRPTLDAKIRRFGLTPEEGTG